GSVNAVAFDPSGAFLASGSSDTSARLWNLRSPPSPLRIHGLGFAEGHLNMVFSPEATRLFASAPNPVGSPADDPGDDSGGHGDCSIGIWDAATGARVSSLVGHKDTVNTLAVTVDGSRLVSGSSDGTARIWDVRTGQCTRVLTGVGKSVRGVRWAHNGEQV